MCCPFIFVLQTSRSRRITTCSDHWNFLNLTSTSKLDHHVRFFAANLKKQTYNNLFRPLELFKPDLHLETRPPCANHDQPEGLKLNKKIELHIICTVNWMGCLRFLGVGHRVFVHGLVFLEESGHTFVVMLDVSITIVDA